MQTNAKVVLNLPLKRKKEMYYLYAKTIFTILL